MFRASGPNDVTKYFWVIHNPGAEAFLNSDDLNVTKHYVQSGLFESTDGMMWRLRFEPGEWPNGKKQSPTNSKIVLFAIPSPKEIHEESMDRNVAVSFRLQHPSDSKTI
jgi:hypothetical protein